MKTSLTWLLFVRFKSTSFKKFYIGKLSNNKNPVFSPCQCFT